MLKTLEVRSEDGGWSGLEFVAIYELMDKLPEKQHTHVHAQ